MDQFPKSFGITFTPTIHAKAEGPTDPKGFKLPNPYVVLVTGAGKGLGLHISLAYAYAGASGIVISSRTKKDLDELEKQIHGINKDIKVLSRLCDTTNEQDVKSLVADVRAEFGRLDVAIANAGVISKYIYDADGSNQRLPKGLIEDDDFARVIDINLNGTRHVGKICLPLLQETKDGAQAFIAITSLASHLPDSQLTTLAYNLSKIAMNRMCESIATDHGGDGVVAFAVHPGAVRTPQTEGHMGEAWEAILTDEIGLCGGFCVWLTQERREWLSGRYLSSTWDTAELEGMKDEIVKEDKLKFRMVV
ncbi:NAD(P)-binding protein [Aulographum hederae CBS 113979]|uniref:NAD(P)-binding protein n=1 Tax=Aulographum hederae CBS 113979 TaxID=1176131 RepID=A0A6G1HAR2_9PEZI|nr:NAD(P)-binding protein [Aulographum hederae CBS 113979]